MNARRHATATSCRAGPAARGRWRRMLTPRRLAWAGAGVVLLGAVSAGFVSGFFAQQADRLEAELLAVSGAAGVKLERVEVTGRQRTDGAAILTALGLTQDRPLLAFDPLPARQALLQLPWVRDAEVTRVLPNRIEILLTERVPLARWQLEGVIRVIDDRGEIVPGAEAAAFGFLPLVVGRGANEAAAELLAMLELEPSLAARMQAAVRVGERRWNLRLDRDLDIALPAEDPAAALARLAELDRDQGLLSRDVVLIDLRQPDRLVMRLAPAALPPVPPSAPGEET